MTKRVIVIGISPQGEPDYFICKANATKDQWDGDWGDKVIELAHYQGNLEGWSSKFSMIPIHEDQTVFYDLEDEFDWSIAGSYDITETVL